MPLATDLHKFNELCASLFQTAQRLQEKYPEEILKVNDRLFQGFPGIAISPIKKQDTPSTALKVVLPHTRQCLYCEKLFEPKSPTQRYCSGVCERESYQECPVCGTSFTRTINDDFTYVCSMGCAQMLLAKQRCQVCFELFQPMHQNDVLCDKHKGLKRCLGCGKIKENFAGDFCSVTCKKNNSTRRHCLTCNTEYDPRTLPEGAGEAFCSARCDEAHLEPRMLFKCTVCQKPYKSRNPGGIPACSPRCKQKYQSRKASLKKRREACTNGLFKSLHAVSRLNEKGVLHGNMHCD